MSRLRQAAAVALLAALLCCGCAKQQESTYYQTGIGEKNTTAWFEYTVESAGFCRSYGSYTAAAGCLLVDIYISLSSTYQEGIPMCSTDFELIYGQESNQSCYCVSNITGNNLMPSEYILAKEQSLVYHIVFEVPSTSSDFTLFFVEYYENGTYGKSFFTSFSLEPSKYV